MKYNQMIHHRRSLRMRGYDYAASGAYYVTICTADHVCILGEISKGEMMLSQFGRIVDDVWLAIPTDFAGIILDVYQIMPNHLHGIIINWGKAVPRSERDLINQIPLDGKRFRGGSIPMGFDKSKFTNQIDFPLMKNPKTTLGKIIRHFKAKATKMIHDSGLEGFAWLRGYYDEIIRSEKDLRRVRRYIRENPLRWQQNVDRDRREDVTEHVPPPGGSRSVVTLKPSLQQPITNHQLTN